MKTEQKRKMITAYVSQMSDKKIDFLHGFLSLANKGCDKRELLKFFAPDTDGNKMDSSFPVDYLRRIEEIYPDAKNGNYVYDYDKSYFGELVNINNIIAGKVLNFFSNI